ncbi:MAG: type II secretion system protein [Candidatus Omnitrophota bacterium]
MSGLKLENKAFSLIELLIATVILSMGLITIFKAFSFSAKSAGISADLTQAVFLAEDKIQELEFERKMNLTAPEQLEDSGQVEKFDWEYTASPLPDLNLYVLKFVVAWKRANEARDVRIGTYLR